MNNLHIDPFHERRARAGMEISQGHFAATPRHHRMQRAITDLWRVYDRLVTVSKQDYGRGDRVRVGLQRGFAATVVIDHDSMDQMDVLIHKKRYQRQRPIEAVHVTEGYAEYLRWNYADNMYQRPSMALSPLELIEGGFATEDKTDLFLEYSFVATQGLEMQLRPEAITLAPAPNNVYALRTSINT